MSSIALVSLQPSRLNQFAQPFRWLLLLCHPLVAFPTDHLARQVFLAVRGAPARICREDGARVRTNMTVRDLDLAVFDRVDGRKLQVLVESGQPT